MVSEDELTSEASSVTLSPTEESSETFSGTPDSESCSTPSDSDSDSDSRDDDDATADVLEQPLYPSSVVTRLAAVVLLMSLGVRHNLTQECMKAIFLLVRALLPKGNVLPSYGTARREMLAASGAVRQTYDICGGCGMTMFRDKPDGTHNYLRLPSCPRPECRKARVDANGKNTCTKYTHLGLVSQLRALVWRPGFRAATELYRRENSTVLEGVQDSPLWNDFLAEHPDFEQTDVALLLAFCTDGVNPFKSGSFSMWPIMWKVLNTPSHAAGKTDLLIMSGLVHGPKKAKSLAPVLELVVEELVELWGGVDVPDPRGVAGTLKLRALLFLVTADYPGAEDILFQQGAGSYNGCMQCCLQGTYHHEMSRMAYGQYRRYLPLEEATLRQNVQVYGSVEARGPPARKTLEQLESWAREAANHSGDGRDPCKLSGMRKTICPLYKAPGAGPSGRFDPTVYAPRDLAHIFKEIFKHLMALFKGERSCEGKLKKPKDLPANRKLKRKKIREYAERLAAWEKQEEDRAELKRKMKEHQISPKLQKLADKRYQRIVGPSGFMRDEALPFQRTGHFGMYDVHMFFTSGICKLVLAPPVLKERTFRVVCILCDCFKLLACVTPHVDMLRELGPKLTAALCDFEAEFPRTEHAIIFHLLLEVYFSIQKLGPPDSWWMYIFERFVGRMSRKIKDRGHPNENLVNTYCVEAGIDGQASSLRAKLEREVGEKVVDKITGGKSWGGVDPARRYAPIGKTVKLTNRHVYTMSLPEQLCIERLTGNRDTDVNCHRIVKGTVTYGRLSFSAKAADRSSRTTHNVCITPHGEFGYIKSFLILPRENRVIAMVESHPISLDGRGLEYVPRGSGRMHALFADMLLPAAYGFYITRRNAVGFARLRRKYLLRPSRGVYSRESDA